MRFQFVQVLWGQRYVEHFLNVALPTCMTTGNLLGFARYDAEFDIYTTADDAAAIGNAPIIKTLAAFMPIRITPVETAGVPTGSDPGKYVLMNALFRLAIDRSDETDSAFFALVPDAAVADGTFARAREMLLSGKRLVMLSATRVSSAGFLAEVRSRFNPHARFAMQVTPRELVDLALRHPHEGIDGFHWGAPEIVDWPSHLYWRAGDDGHVLHAFHLHPLAIYPRVRGPRPRVSIDDTWLTEAFPDPSEMYVMQDSDEGYWVDFDSRPEDTPRVRVRDDHELHVASWAGTYAGSLQWHMAAHPIVVHRGPLTSEWQAVIAESNARIEAIRAKLDGAPVWDITA